MQAIESVENAALEVPRRNSPFRALLWKEWRQQRWIFLSLAGLAYALLLSAAILVWPDRFNHVFDENRDIAAGVLAGCAAFLGICSVVVFSANAFSGERDDNTEQFLEMIPCSRSKLFRVKLGFVLFLVLLELLPLVIAVIGLIACLPHVHYSELVDKFGLVALVLVAGVLVLAIVPALIASFGGSVIATTLASLPVLAACIALMYSPTVLALPIKSAIGNEMLAALITVLMLVTILLAAWRMWIRADRTWRSSLRTSAATAALLIAYVAVPVALYLYVALFAPLKFLAVVLAVLMLATILLAARRVWTRPERTWRSSLPTAAAMVGLLIAYVAVPVLAAYLYVTSFAPLNFFLDRRSSLTYGCVSAISPGGKYVTFYTHYNGWGSHGTRAALTDVDSGRTRWLTRFRDSFVWPVSRFWSPSGNQFVLTEANQWLWPLARDTAKPMYFVEDARSGEKRSFHELCPSLTQMPTDILPLIGWYSEQVFAFQNGRDIFFADIEHHAVRQCKMPATLPSLSLPYWRWLPITRRGIFAVPEGVLEEGKTRVLRYAPDLPVAESLVLHGIFGKPESMDVSADGQWLLVATGSRYSASTQPDRWYVAPLRNGAEAAWLQRLAPYGRANLFVPNSHEILLFQPRDTAVTLFDAETHRVREIPLNVKGESWRYNNMPAQGYPVTFSPKGQFAVIQWQPYLNVVVDLSRGTSSALNIPYASTSQLQWLGEDRLLFDRYTDGAWKPWIINRDGTGARPLLAK